MPRETPQNLKDKLPKRAQEIYESAHDSALKQYKGPGKRRGNESREEAAHGGEKSRFNKLVNRERARTK